RDGAHRRGRARAHAGSDRRGAGGDGARASDHGRGPPRGDARRARRGDQHLAMRLEVGVPGRVEYRRALAWQEALVARRLAGGPVALRRWVAWHGFALNVAHDVSGFAPITPCGITGVEMTSVAREGGPGEVTAVLPVVLDRFVAAFGYAGWTPLEAHVLGDEARS